MAVMNNPAAAETVSRNDTLDRKLAKIKTPGPSHGKDEQTGASSHGLGGEPSAQVRPDAPQARHLHGWQRKELRDALRGTHAMEAIVDIDLG